MCVSYFFYLELAACHSYISNLKWTWSSLSLPAAGLKLAQKCPGQPNICRKRRNCLSLSEHPHPCEPVPVSQFQGGLFMLLCWALEAAPSIPFLTSDAVSQLLDISTPLKVWFWPRGQKVSEIVSLQMLQTLLLPVIPTVRPRWPVASKGKMFMNGHIISEILRIFWNYC